MRKIASNIALYAICSAVFYLGGMYILNKVNVSGKPAVYLTNDYYISKGGGSYEKFKSADSLKNLDVAIIGSSRAYRHYDPSIFSQNGLKAWNLGSSAQPIENTELIIKDILIPAKPRYILLDIARLGFGQNSIESSIDLLTNVNRPKLSKDILLKQKDVRLFNAYTSAYMLKNRPPMYKDKEYQGAGFSTKSDSLPKSKKEQLKYITEEKKNNFLVTDLSSLENILEACDQANQKIILVHSPVSDFYSDSAQKHFMKQVDSICNERNVQVYDYQHVPGIETINHFYDDSHLNQAGVALFNRRLLKEVSFE